MSPERTGGSGGGTTLPPGGGVTGSDEDAAAPSQGRGWPSRTAEEAPEVADVLLAAARTYLDHLVVERGFAENTIVSYRRDLRRYLSWLASAGVRVLDEVGEGEVSGFLAELREPSGGEPGLAVTSAARTLVAVRGFHRFCHEEGLAPLDPARGVSPPNTPRRLPKALPVDTVLSLVAAAGDEHSPRGLRDRALVELLYSTGARISEAVGLDLDDVDVAERVVVLRGKGGRERVVPVGRPALAAVEAYRVRGRPDLASRGGGGPAVFLNARGGRLSRQSGWQVLRDTADRAGVGADLSPHTLRHSFATHLMLAGADVRVVQELLGHASVTTTQIYTRVTVNSLREVYALAHPRALG
ncbi:site-specific tyrosine recombinase XerD [Actinoalloteichus caeruleus]|uniref:Tyrosine recombinase XerC n=1 Tax=Actinoalloteichus caeruleus DSM 43889 TaxID=1120930 RepID=A0ABT1JGG4_ACTCY|nr:site-specific tyrosine recombinase XerD [Actinoalloteichus caeruleus]MCP2331567.1 integrase/recombinase XerD [Actinoalloteichus caeruleus DSM 43889]